MTQLIPYFCYQAELGHFEQRTSNNKISQEEAEKLAGRKLSNKQGVLLDKSLVVRYDVDMQGNDMYFNLRKL